MRRYPLSLTKVPKRFDFPCFFGGVILTYYVSDVLIELIAYWADKESNYNKVPHPGGKCPQILVLLGTGNMSPGLQTKVDLEIGKNLGSCLVSMSL
jgi:hypothetical protein